MNCAGQHSPRPVLRSTPGSAESDEIARFRGALDAIVEQQPDDHEYALNALIDFFACRCRNTQQLHTLGAGLFTALNKQASVLVTTGVFDEQIALRREQDTVRIEVDQQPLAEIPLDDAIRLATTLHGARQTTIGRSRAA